MLHVPKATTTRLFLTIVGAIAVCSCAPREPAADTLEQACTGVLQSQEQSFAGPAENMPEISVAMTDEERKVAERDIRDAQILPKVMFKFCESALNRTLKGDALSNQDHGSFGVFPLHDDEREEFFSGMIDAEKNYECSDMAYVRLDMAERRYLYLFCSEGTSLSMVGSYEKSDGNWRRMR